MHSTMVASHATQKSYLGGRQCLPVPPRSKTIYRASQAYDRRDGLHENIILHSYGKNGKYDKVSAKTQSYIRAIKRNLNTWLYK